MGHALNKLSSGRWLMTVMLTLTYCIGIIGLAIMTIIGKLTAEAFLGVWAGFATVVILVAQWYFKKDDKAEIQDADKPAPDKPV